MRPRLTRLCRWTAVVVACLGLAALFIQHAPVTTWAVPIPRGITLSDWTVQQVSRTPARVRVDLVRGQDRTAIAIVHRNSPTEYPPLATTGRYKLTSQVTQPDTEALATALAGRLEAWHATFPSPPAFVGPVGKRPTPLQRLEWVLNQLAALLTLCLLLGLAPNLVQSQPRTPAAVWAALAAAAAAMWLTVWTLGTAGVWHANQHGHDRLADLIYGTPAPVANLSLLHGQGYYVVLAPLYQLLGSPEPFHLTLALATAACLVWFCGLHSMLDDPWRALGSVTFAMFTPVFLRVAPSESMYVPALLYVGFALWWFELHLRTRQIVWFLAALPPAFLAMQTRAELIALLPIWIGWMMLCRQPDWLRTTAWHPAIPVSLLLAGAAFVPRLLGFLAIDKPGTSATDVYDPIHTPRTMAVLVLLTASAVMLPTPRDWMMARARRVTTRARYAAGTLLCAALAAWAWSIWHNPGDYDRWPTISPMLEADIAAPWLAMLCALGAVSLWRRDAPVGSFVVGSLAMAWLLYLPRHDCLSTYVRTSLHLTPLMGVLFAEGILSLPLPLRGRSMIAVGALATSLVWSAPWLTTRFPKQQQGDLMRHARKVISSDTTVIFLDEEAQGEGAPGRIRRRVTDIEHHLGPAWRTASLSAWARGELRDAGPVVFFRTADCHRALLSHGTPRQAWTGTALVEWYYRGASMTGTAPRARVTGLPDDKAFVHPACARADAVVTSKITEVPLERRVAGSIYEEIQGNRAWIGIYQMPSSP